MNYSSLAKDLCWHSLIFFIVTALGYLFVSGGLYGFFFLKASSKPTPIATKHLRGDRSIRKIWTAVRHDVILSLGSSAIFAVCAAIMTSAYQFGYTQLYLDASRHSGWYIVFSLGLVLFLQDTYFYFTHRLAHHPKCYSWLHKGHHHSNNPTPLTAFSFDPGEALLQAIYLMAAVCIIPMHITVLCAVVLVMTLGALIHHFSLRMFQNSTFGQWLGSWMVGPMHHWFHHRRYNVHYGLYFTLWDKLLGTHHHGYEEILDARSSTAKSVVDITDTSAEKKTLSETIPFPVSVKKAS